MTRLTAHPLADLFPLIEGDDFGALVEDIRAHGVIDRIELLDGAILDGRNRYNALVHLVESGEVLGDGWGHRAGEALAPEALEPDNQWFRKFNRHVDGDPLPWVLSKNLKRRHLDESQRAMVAAKLKTMKLGDNQHVQGLQICRPSTDPVPPHIPPIGGISAQAAAKLLNVGTRSVSSAAAVLKEGTPELQHAVEQGKVAVSTAEVIATLPKDDQAEIVARGEKDILAQAKEIRARQRATRFTEVSAKLAAISEGSRPLPTGQRFPIIYADPATRYVSGFGNRSIENHYPTMTTEELCALPVGDLALDDAVLFIWSTVPQLANTMRIIAAWGFTYVSEWCWDKVDQGTGHWGFNAHESLLIATRGTFPAPVPGTQPRSLYREKKGEHSEKPAWFAEQIERIWPNLPKIELFCRAARPGWAVWGNQAESQAKADTEIAARKGAPVPAAEGMDSSASRLAGGRTLAAAEDGAGVASSAATTSQDQVFGETERAVWKALGAIEANVTIKGPIIDELLADQLIMTGAVDCGYILTTRGQSTLGMYDAYFNPSVDDLSTDDLQKLNRNTPEASGTAREAPSTGCGTAAKAPRVGTQSAPPSPIDDGLDIPAFLRRRPDNSLPNIKVDHAAS